MGSSFPYPFPGQRLPGPRTALACPGLVAADTLRPGFPLRVLRRPCWTKASLPFGDGTSCFFTQDPVFRHMVSEGILGIARNEKGKCAEMLLGFLPGGKGILLLEQGG